MFARFGPNLGDFDRNQALLVDSGATLVRCWLISGQIRPSSCDNCKSCEVFDQCRGRLAESGAIPADAQAQSVPRQNLVSRAPTPQRDCAGTVPRREDASSAPWETTQPRRPPQQGSAGECGRRHLGDGGVQLLSISGQLPFGFDQIGPAPTKSGSASTGTGVGQLNAISNNFWPGN